MEDLKGLLLDEISTHYDSSFWDRITDIKQTDGRFTALYLFNNRIEYCGKFYDVEIIEKHFCYDFELTDVWGTEEVYFDYKEV